MPRRGKRSDSRWSSARPITKASWSTGSTRRRQGQGHRHQSRRLHPYVGRAPRRDPRRRVAGRRGASVEHLRPRGISPPLLGFAGREGRDLRASGRTGTSWRSRRSPERRGTRRRNALTMSERKNERRSGNDTGARRAAHRDRSDRDRSPARRSSHPRRSPVPSAPSPRGLLAVVPDRRRRCRAGPPDLTEASRRRDSPMVGTAYLARAGRQALSSRSATRSPGQTLLDRRGDEDHEPDPGAASRQGHARSWSRTASRSNTASR